MLPIDIYLTQWKSEILFTKVNLKLGTGINYALHIYFILRYLVVILSILLILLITLLHTPFCQSQTFPPIIRVSIHNIHYICFHPFHHFPSYPLHAFLPFLSLPANLLSPHFAHSIHSLYCDILYECSLNDNTSECGCRWR